MIARLLAAGTGLWLMAAPDVLDYGATAASIDRIIGPIGTSVSIIAISEVARGVRLATVPLGAVLLIAPLPLGYELAAVINSLTCGAIFILTAFLASRRRFRFGGGWKVVLKSPTRAKEASEMVSFLKKEAEKRPRVVVVTGATAGVGRATVREFAKEGAYIGLLARSQVALEATQREVEALGGRAVAVPTDVADADQVEAAAETVERELGPIDIWVNNAMVSVFSPVRKMTAEDYKRVTDVTYLGYVHGTLSALKRMNPRNRGLIVQVGSALAYRGIPLQSAYCGAKHAIEGFTDSLRCELINEKSKVRVTEVHLPAMNTPQFSWVKSRLPGKPQPVPPIYQPEVAARTIIWATHNKRRGILVGWPTVAAVYANKIAPGLLDLYLGKTGVDSQQTDEPDDPDRQNNVWQPLDEDRGAHGGFDEIAEEKSYQVWFSMNWNRIAAAGLITAAALAALKRSR
jgi:NAD(P)-dependent dehydrogenase (short-subunit alcohol dehydrogenase family)